MKIFEKKNFYNVFFYEIVWNLLKKLIYRYLKNTASKKK